MNIIITQGILSKRTFFKDLMNTEFDPESLSLDDIDVNAPLFWVVEEGELVAAETVWGAGT